MKIVGLTGGIGSGKTTVAKLFGKLGVPIFFADEVAKNLMQNDKYLKDNIIKEFGSKSYINDKLNRDYLAAKVFKNKKHLQKLNNLVHPVVKANFKIWLTKQNATYVLYENAILFETKSKSFFDTIICVTAKIDTRIKRIMKRDNITKNQVIDRINNQWPDENKIELSDIIIYNDCKNNLEKEVLKIHKYFLKKFD